jgi:5-methyltetrahydropteroyltriglutamate--homocysteine methyltransferase
MPEGLQNTHMADIRILTTHVGSLPGPPGFDATAPQDEQALRGAVQWVVGQQRAVGLDIINEGELTKGGDWLSFADRRLGGFEERPFPAGGSMVLRGRDREAFADFYQYATERQTLFFTPDDRIKLRRRYTVATSPVSYVGLPELTREIDLLRSAVDDTRLSFLTSTAPASLEVYRGNEHYATSDEYVFALADALRVEYEAIAHAGILLQIDDAWTVALWDRIGIEMGLEAFKKYCMVRVEALNHALRNVPEESVRYHFCWGSWHGPHAFDLPLADIVDVMLAVKAKFYSFEAANVRHEHEYRIWDRVTLPRGKVIMPGVVTHSTDLIEHPELVSERIQRFAALVGPEHVIASCDCGFGGRTHPQIAWAKLQALCDGAALASHALNRSRR